MFASLFMLAASLLHGHAPERAIGVATTVTNVVAARDASWAFPRLAADDPDAARAKLGRLLVIWSFHESSFRPEVTGDSGRSVGLMQIGPALVGRSAAELRNPHTNLVAALELLERLVHDCGSLESGLGAYASGRCNGAPALVARRCALIGGC